MPPESSPCPTSEGRENREGALVGWIVGTAAMTIISVISATANVILAVTICRNKAQMSGTAGDVELQGEPMEAGIYLAMLLLWSPQLQY